MASRPRVAALAWLLLVAALALPAARGCPFLTRRSDDRAALVRRGASGAAAAVHPLDVVDVGFGGGLGARRLLLQGASGCDSSCKLSVDGEERTYCSCQEEGKVKVNALLSRMHCDPTESGVRVWQT